MKKMLFGLIATVLLSVSGNAQRFQPSEFKNIGMEHNRLLDVAYTKILTDKVTNENKEEVVTALIKDFEGKNYPENDLKLGIQLLNESFQSLPEKGIVTDEPTLNNYKIDNDVKSYLEKLLFIIDSNDSTKDLNLEIDNLENQIVKDVNLKNDKLLTLFSATSVARYSNQYWEANSGKWIALNTNNTTNKLAARGKKIVRADVVGAVGGAVGALVVNAIPGAGQVGYVGAIVGGAVGNSAVEAASQFLDWCGL